MSEKINSSGMISHKPKKKSKYARINAILIAALILTMVVVIVVMTFNIFRIGLKKDSLGNTVEVDKKNSVKNELYTIGNNPTELQQTYFKELTKSIEEKDEKAISENVVKCFVSDYFTWTNKDGNYEVGGIQYIYGSKYASFEQESRWKFYKDLDLYLSQYGRENLLEVKDVEIVSPAVENGEYMIFEHQFDSYYLEARWTYKDSSKMDTSDFQNEAYFYVINNNGRMEIAEIVNPKS